MKSSNCIFWALILTVACACGPSKRTRDLHEVAVSMVGTLPKSARLAADTDELITLGRRLYMDTILSKDRTISCHSCHQIESGSAGADGKRVSQGVGGQEGSRNSPTVWNAALHVAQFWDGRARDLEEQAGMPILNPVEMAMPSKTFVEERLRGDKDYPQLFRKVFRNDANPIRYENLTKAIAAFERTLITSDRFDRFLSGDLGALNGRELKGLALFVEIGCVSCHNGKLLGGNTFRKVGGVIPYENLTDRGRYEFTKIEAEKFVFKVPSLRNIAVTAPYFHDGTRVTLESAVTTMAQIQLGKNLNRLQVAYLVDFLRTLTDPRLERKE